MERPESLDGVEEPRMVPEGVSLGYARVSTRDQSLESQRQQLAAAGCYDVYADHGKSGATMTRPELDVCLRALQPGNTLVVTKLDRLGRTVRGLVELLDTPHWRIRSADTAPPWPPCYRSAGRCWSRGSRSRVWPRSGRPCRAVPPIYPAWRTWSGCSASHGRGADTQTQGPQQTQNSMISDTRVASERTLLERSNRIHYGNLLTLPIANGGFLYVEPLFTERLTTQVDGSTFPQLSRVLVSYREPGSGGVRVGYAPTFAEALDQVFGSGAGTIATPPGGDARAAPSSPSVPGSTPSPEGSVVSPSMGDDGALIDAVLELNRALEEVRQAQQQGFAAYGAALERLQSAIDVFLASEGGG